MELLKELWIEKFNGNPNDLPLREASRMIAIDESWLIPILFVSNYGYHKLPWWGIDEWENRIEALRREMIEETGCEVEVQGEVWKILEYRTWENSWFSYDLKQISYCYYWKILSKSKSVDFTEKELADWFSLKWLSLTEALDTLEADKPTIIEGDFIKKRDLCFINKVINSNLL